MPRRMAGLLLAASAATLAVLAQLVPGAPLIVRAALALALVFFLPGYGLVQAAFPQGAQRPVERLLYCVGLSIVATALGGFALHWTPWGLQASTWAILLAGVTLLGCAAALLRARTPSARAADQRLLPTFAQAALFGLAFLVTLGAVNLAAAGARLPRSPGFTQLWAIPGTASNELQLGVENQERMRVEYLVQIEDQGQILQRWPAISLNAGERWQIAAQLSADVLAHPAATVMLYRQDSPDRVYRQVALMPIGAQ